MTNDGYKDAVITKLRFLRAQRDCQWRRFKETRDEKHRDRARQYAETIREIESIATIASQIAAGVRKV